MQITEQLAAGETWTNLGLVFCMPIGEPTHPKTISYHFTKHVRRLDLPVIRLHDLRHTVATILMDAGESARYVQERLGHCDVAFTLRVYSHPSDERHAEIARRLAALVDA